MSVLGNAYWKDIYLIWFCFTHSFSLFFWLCWEKLPYQIETSLYYYFVTNKIQQCIFASIYPEQQQHNFFRIVIILHLMYILTKFPNCDGQCETQQILLRIKSYFCLCVFSFCIIEIRENVFLLLNRIVDISDLNRCS